jgi:GMP synthase (glutamine-hydrolysing)
VPRCAVIRHVAFEDLGCWEAELPALGYDVQYLEAGVDDLTPFVDARLAIVLGGPIGVGDAHRFPVIDQEIELIRQRLAADRPVLGVCLGLQFMAAALGAPVVSGDLEFGFTRIGLTEVGAASPVRHVATTPMFAWHGDSVELPKGATLLASTPDTAVHAFSHGRSLGVQFHPEVDPRTFERWIIGNFKELDAEALDVQQVRAHMQEHGPASVQASLAMLREWVAGI